MKTHTQLLKRLLATRLFSTLVLGCPNSPLENANQAYDDGDYKKAFEIYKTLAEQGKPEAQYNLGLMYENGQVVPQDYAQAVKWYRKAADQGYSLAQNSLGIMYENGQVVPQDYIEAHKWFNIATSNSCDSGMEYRNRVALKMTPEQIAEAQKLAHEWKSQPAK